MLLRGIKLDVVVGELLEAMRGSRSQRWVSKRLGYTYNQMWKWESGKTRIRWDEFVALCDALKINLAFALRRALGYQGEAQRWDLLVQLLISKDQQDAVCERLGVSHRIMRRWLSGETLPTLAEAFSIIDVSTSLAYFIGLLIDEGVLPSLEERRYATHTDLFNEVPEVGAVLFAMRCRAYEALPKHDDAFIAAFLGIPIEVVRYCIGQLTAHNLIKLDGDLYKIIFETDDESVETTRTNVRLADRKTKIYWQQRSISYLEQAPELPEAARSRFPIFQYAVSDEGMGKLLALVLKFTADVNLLLADDQEHNPSTRVGVLSLQIFDNLLMATCPAGGPQRDGSPAIGTGTHPA